MKIYLGDDPLLQGRRRVLRHGAHHHSVVSGEGVGVLADADLHRLLIMLLLLTLLRRPLDLDVALALDLGRLRHRLEADGGERLVSVEGGAVVVHDPVDRFVLVGVDRGRAGGPRGQNADLGICSESHRICCIWYHLAFSNPEDAIPSLSGH